MMVMWITRWKPGSTYTLSCSGPFKGGPAADCWKTMGMRGAKTGRFKKSSLLDQTREDTNRYIVPCLNPGLERDY